MKNSITLNTASLALASLLATGCTHAMKITKGPPPPAAVAGPAQPLRVGFTSVGTDHLLESAINNVKGHSSVAEAKEDYKPASGFSADYVCQLTRDTKFKSSGQNFLITFPGYICFMHAIMGYQYKAEITTHSTLLDCNSNVVSQVDIETPYTFRHCSFGRGATTGCIGWLTPGYGIADVIPAVIFAAKYDKGATRDFLEQATPSYSSYVSAKVLEQLAQAQAGCVKAAPAVTANDAEALPQAGSRADALGTQGQATPAMP